ncbi:hypothetical protein HWB90_gp115 [Mycobacterium phage Fowlmouth]|uniref:Membrane protein n=2 Tax=Fowlmouthvirus fowlmouth TaxID=2845652 RepID=A0A7G8LPW5_9CAUD|nr:hypothetical protein HWB90_gp115 [Mycobacterium phage Fowlmouth]AYN58024.1 hypothetical protein SEA_FOWLMOUTH_75 [Mycobacterium phage Fowlmouth]QNJ59287.1 membrane protein [Mycobacterium phage MrMiyagi]
MVELSYLALGFASGTIITSSILIGVQRRLVARILHNAQMEAVATDLETRRLAHDFGIDEMPRPGMGPDADESSLFEVRPGAMHLAHLATKRKKNTPR